MAGNAGKTGLGWGIAWACLAQAGIIGAIVALLSGSAPAPAVTMPAQVPLQAVHLPYTLTVNGQARSGVFNDGYGNGPLPLFIAHPAQELFVTLRVTIPATGPQLDLLSLEVDDTGLHYLYDNWSQPLSAGTHTFTAHWFFIVHGRQGVIRNPMLLGLFGPGFTGGGPIAVVGTLGGPGYSVGGPALTAAG